MNLSTPISIPKSEYVIDPRSNIMTIGSCFSEHMGNKLSIHQFACNSNPFGTVFNPCSIAHLLKLAKEESIIAPSEIEEHNGRFFHYDFHSSFDAVDPQSVVQNINNAISSVHSNIKQLDYLIITFGTSIGYHHIDQDRLVSNCHKVPNYQFRRMFLPDDVMHKIMLSAIESLREIRPSLKIILSVSPVRHTKEGLVDNGRSKAKLIHLCHSLVDSMDHTFYFPSYEIMMDELRDYRFYKPDMIHPSSQAVNIIWNRFVDTYFSKSSLEKKKDFEKLNLATNHIPFDPSSEGHQKFLKNQLSLISNLKVKYTEVDFSSYEEKLKQG